MHALLVAGAAAGAASLALLAINLFAVPRLSRRARPLLRAPRVSVVIPARNEARDIEATVRSHLSASYPNFEVVVVDDRSTDGTGDVLASLRRGDSRLRVIFGGEPPSGWLGKPHALHQGAEAARGEVLLFADADVRYDSRTLSEAIAFLERGRLDFLALLPRLEARGSGSRSSCPT